MLSFLAHLRRAFARTRAHGPSRTVRAWKIRLEAESLEARLAPADFTLTLPDGGGKFTLALDASGGLSVTAGDDVVFKQPVDDVGTLTVKGTDADEQLSVDLSLLGGRVPALVLKLDGGGGADALSYVGPPGGTKVEMGLETTTIQHAWFLGEVTGFESVTVETRHSGSFATLTGSAGDDKFVARPAGRATLTSPDGIERVAVGFTTVVADGGGGADGARLADTPGDDDVVMRDGYTAFVGADGSTVHAYGFASVVAVSDAGGRDAAWLYDSAGPDRGHTEPGFARIITAGGSSYSATKFPDVRLLAQAGGRDELTVVDTPTNDELHYRPTGVSLLRDARRTLDTRFQGFENVRLYGTGGRDRAILFDTPSTDVFYATSGASTIATYTNTARTFQLLATGIEVFRLSGRPRQLDLFHTVNGRPPRYVVEPINFVPLPVFYAGLASSAAAAGGGPSFVSTPYYVGALSRAEALQRLRQLAIRRDPRIARARSSGELAVVLRDHVHRNMVPGVNSDAWVGLDPYHRYVLATVLRYERVICGGITIMYEDLLEAFGLQSRRASLYTADGRDNHASVDVWIGGRWVAMDPTFNAVFVSRAGRLLSYADLASGVPFTISRNGYAAQPAFDWQLNPPYRRYLARVVLG